MAVTWSPSDRSASVTLSGGNLAATGNTTADGGVRATTSLPAGGKVYWEELAGVIDTNRPNIGIGNAAASLAFYLGRDNDSLSYAPSGAVIRNNTAVAAYASFAAGDRIGIAADLANAKIFFSKNGVWQGSSDPATNTGGVSISALNAGPYFAATSCYNTASGTANFGATAFAYPRPAGFAPAETIDGAVTKTLGAVVLSSAAAAIARGAVAQTLRAIAVTAIGFGPRVAVLTGTLRPITLAAGQGGGALSATLGPIAATSRLFKWAPVAVTPEIWSPV